MSDFENVLDGVEPEEAKKVVEHLEQRAKSNKKFDVFEDAVEPQEIVVDKLKRFSRMFSASSPINIPNERLEVLDRIMQKINSMGFTFRSMNDPKDKLNNDVTERSDRKEYYLPWAKFGDATVDAKISKATEKSIKTACWLEVKKKAAINNAKGKNVPMEDLVSDYNLLSPAIKGFGGRNVHILLGDDCETAINFMLVYTECAAEQSIEIKYDKAQKTGYFIEASNRLNIPVFNLYKQDCEDRLVEYLNTFN